MRNVVLLLAAMLVAIPIFAQTTDFAGVSRHHCVLDIAPPAIHVRDLGSRNGTFVNGVRIDDTADEQPEAPVAGGLDLKDGDQFQLGSTAFQVKVEGVAAVPALPLFF